MIEVVLSGKLVPGLHVMQAAGYVLVTVAFVANALPENISDVIASVVALRRRRVRDKETIAATVATTTSDVSGTAKTVPAIPTQ